LPTLALIHTVHSVIPEFESLCAHLLPGVKVAHLLDETILHDAIERGNADADVTASPNAAEQTQSSSPALPSAQSSPPPAHSSPYPCAA